MSISHALFASLRTLFTYGRFRAEKGREWPYVLGYVLGMLLLAVALAALTGCVATGTKVTEEQLLTFRKGETHYAEVLERLGPPTSMTLNPDMSRFVTYSYSQSQVRAVNYIPLVGAFLQGGDSEQTSVTFEFAPDGRLHTYSATSGTLGMGTGFSSGARQK